MRLLLDGAPLNALYDSARRHGQMLEVLVDGLNQKALDAWGIPWWSCPTPPYFMTITAKIWKEG